MLKLCYVLRADILFKQVLLRADKSAANFSDKSLLKNLGHWLGMLSLAKNKPILHTDIDMKSLLIESYNKGLQVTQILFSQLYVMCFSNSNTHVFHIICYCLFGFITPNEYFFMLLFLSVFHNRRCSM